MLDFHVPSRKECIKKLNEWYPEHKANHRRMPAKQAKAVFISCRIKKEKEFRSCVNLKAE